MACDPLRQHRCSIRLKGYDYTQPGAYFITIVTRNRESLFGMVVDGVMRLNHAGQMVQRTWNEISSFYPGVNADAFVVMPNHVHGIIILVGATPRGCPDPPGSDPHGSPDPLDCPGTDTGQAQGPLGQAQGPLGQAQGPAPTGLSLGDVVHRFKTLTTKRYADGVKQSGWAPFPGKLWQRNYYEHIIRNERALDRIREYIAHNPLCWALDRENPKRTGTDAFDSWLEHYFEKPEEKLA